MEQEHKKALSNENENLVPIDEFVTSPDFLGLDFAELEIRAVAAYLKEHPEDFREDWYTRMAREQFQGWVDYS